MIADAEAMVLIATGTKATLLAAYLTAVATEAGIPVIDSAGETSRLSPLPALDSRSASTTDSFDDFLYVRRAELGIVHQKRIGVQQGSSK